MVQLSARQYMVHGSCLLGLGCCSTGAFGTVYKARLDDVHDVAVKLLKPEADKHQLKAFLNEVQMDAVSLFAAACRQHAQQSHSFKSTWPSCASSNCCRAASCQVCSEGNSPQSKSISVAIR